MSDIIALMGNKGAGKDTVAKFIEKNNTKYDKVVIMSFADALKDAVSDIFNFRRDLLEGDTVESREWRETEIPYLSDVMHKHVTPRYLLQQIGTNILRKHLYDDLWVDSVLVKIHIMEDQAKKAKQQYLYVITDCRFANEIFKLSQSGNHVKYVEVDRRNRNTYFYNLAYKHNTTKNPILRLYYKYKLRNIHRSEWDWIGVVKDPILIYNIGTTKNLEELVKCLILKD